MSLNPIAYTDKVLADFLRYQVAAPALADVRLYAHLRVFVDVDRTPPEVVTVYKANRPERYWQEDA